MSSPSSPLLPVDRTQVAAAISPDGQFQYDFSERLHSIDSDLTDTERESERLARKLSKRLSGAHSDVVSPGEYFIERLTKWHSNKKVEKLKALLATHFPRVKHLEEDVVSSATTVHENKEAVLKQAVALLGLVDKQIDYYQQHMNFLDDVINDIRQCDFTLVKEITEMKTAFAFYQEVDERPRSSSRTSSHSNPYTVLLKIGADSNGYVPGRRVLEDLASFNCPFPATKADIDELVNDVPVVVHAPRSVRRDVILAADLTAVGTSGSSPVHVDHSEAATFDRVVVEVRGDGADYKRKCLKAHAVDLQQLQLDLRPAKEGAGPQVQRSVKVDGHADQKEPRKSLSMSPSNFMRHVSERLSEMTHFSKPSAVAQKQSTKQPEKHRSWSASSLPGHTGEGTDGGKISHAQEGASRSGRAGSVGGVVNSAVFQTVEQVAASAPTALVHSTTPRPCSVGHDQHAHGHGNSYFSDAHSHPHTETHSHSHSHHLSIPAIPTAHNHEPSHKVEGGIAFEGAAPVLPSPPGAFFSTERQNQHLTAAGIMAHGNGHSFTSNSAVAGSEGGRSTHTPSLSGQMSTSSSSSNLSLSAGSSGAVHPPSVLDRTELRRLKFAALRNHYPNLYQIAQAHSSDPATKLLARRLNKCLMFKDELKRSLVRAELVQETENSCLCKMRKVQHELQDVMGEHAGLHVHGHFSVHLTSVGLSLSNCCSPLMAKSPPSVSVPIIPSPRHDLGHSISGGSSTFLSSLSLSAEQAALSHSSAGAHASSPEQSHTEESAAATVSSSPGNVGAGSGSSAAHKSPRHPLMTHFAHLSDHDLSSTDDEHDHLTGTNSHASSQSRDNSFSQLLTEAATTPRAGASSSSAATSGLVTSGPPEHSTPSDPTIIDPNQDAAVNQLSYELCEAAHQCAQHLKVLMDEEEEAADKLMRVRSLLSTASHIDQQLGTTLSPQK